METYLRNSVISNTESFKKWLDTFLLNQFVYGEGLSVRLTYKYLKENNIENIWNLDTSITVQNVAKESRNGGKLVAYRMSDLILDIYEINLLKEYKQRITDKKSYGNPAIVFAIVMNEFGISVSDAIVYYGYSIIVTLIQNAVRTIPLGQKDGQLLLNKSFDILEEVCKKILTLDEDDIGANIPGLEISQINHENLSFRLFMS
ncbi:urease accessory protein UreF [Clostridium tertium]|uniref:urease accessory protein UreF n=2 Tax=Clostridium TaxID=1485 RepID=UPI0024B3A1A7|nr:urease accessory UreF family protein [Clostridium tertium]MDI9215577.1 urease accessory protein UreF [Clostridium tertium]